jgi:DNA-binding transcriptional LysR family regulator
MTLGPATPSLNSLDLFASVVKLGSVSQAARAHGIAQPSASSRLADLERKVGLRLLERGPTGSTPTIAGQLVAEWAESVLGAARDLEAGVDALRADIEGRLRVHASYTVAEYLLPSWLGRFLRRWPVHGVELKVQNSSDVLDQVRLGHADLGFIESIGDVGALDEADVDEDYLVAVVAPNHPWAGMHSVDAADLVGVPLITREAGSGTRGVFDAAIVAAGLPKPQAALELGSTSAVKAAVANGGSPAVLSRLAVEVDVARGVLVSLPVDGVDLTRSLRAVWLTDRPMSDGATRLLEQLLGKHP